MALCCSNSESFQGEDFIETFNKIEKPEKGQYGLNSTGACQYDPHKYLNNIRSGIVPVPKNIKDCNRITSGELSNFSQRQIRKSNY